jgi:glycosyltransferase involved in cell wall biosynthesis
LIRNGEKNITWIKQFFTLFGKQFKEYHVIIVENDSIDKTRQILLKWQQETPENVTILGCGINKSKCAMNTKFFQNHLEFNVSNIRMQNLANVRNIYLQYVQKNFAHYDYMMICDLDLHATFHNEGLNHGIEFLSSNENCNVITSNSRRKFFKNCPLLDYYDAFAYLTLGKEKGFANLKSKKNWDNEVKKKVIHEVGEEPFQVASAFGGCAIYKIKAILDPNIKYSAAPIGRIGCEHVYFHDKIPNIYFDPSMLVEIYKH